jgi:type IV secretory pathway VirB2 component (pilin)
MYPWWIRARVAFAVASGFLISSAVSAQDSYSDPAGSRVLESAIGWLQGALLGTIATVVAIIAVATVGFMTVTGRMDVRRAVRVVFGCFIIFGASTIANGLIAAMSLSGNSSDQSPPEQQVSAPRAPAVPVNSVPAVSDPYAGAAVPSR